MRVALAGRLPNAERNATLAGLKKLRFEEKLNRVCSKFVSYRSESLQAS